MTESQENYIKTIHALAAGRGYACIKDIAARLSVTKASASRAVSLLVDLGLARRDSRRRAVLTEAGRARAGEVESRFKTVQAFWTRVLGVGADAAAQEACRLEHVLSDASLQAMRQAISNDTSGC